MFKSSITITAFILIFLGFSSTMNAKNKVLKSTTDGVNAKLLNCKNNITLNDTIPCYQKRVLSEGLEYFHLSKHKENGVTINSYFLKSQNWDTKVKILPSHKWKYNVNIYIPDNALRKKAVVIVNNGTNIYNSNNLIISKPDFSKKMLINIAKQTKTVVISVNNIPNQYLKYGKNNKKFSEDSSIAYSWKLFMSNPKKYPLITLQIPMVAAVSQAISLAEKELASLNIKKFFLSGISKRGWATWLTAIADSRVSAIIPFAIDLLNTKAGIKNIYKSYGNNWPISFFSYINEDIDIKIEKPEFLKLMKIVDPLEYMNNPKYKSRFDIPKYIINSSGDNFFVPDNSKFYYDKLRGEKSFRMVPNSSHYGIKRVVEESLITFINRIQKAKKLPTIKVINKVANKDSFKFTMKFSEAPLQVTSWSAINKNERDFRYDCGIRYKKTLLLDKNGSSILSLLPLTIYTKVPKKGWKASFIQATFKDGYVATTQTFILPENKYPITAPKAKKEFKYCKSINGRGLGKN